MSEIVRKEEIFPFTKSLERKTENVLVSLKTLRTTKCNHEEKKSEVTSVCPHKDCNSTHQIRVMYDFVDIYIRLIL